MRVLQWTTFILLAILGLTKPLAAAQSIYQQLQVPLCLANKLSPVYGVLAENQRFKIIDVPLDEMDKIAHMADTVHCGRFINVSQRLENTTLTNRPQAALKLLQAQQTAPLPNSNYTIKHPKQVKAALQWVEADNIWLTLSSLTSFTNRSATLESGEKTATWLRARFEQLAIEYGRDDTATFEVDTGFPYIQKSVVTVIGKDINAPAVIIGAHMDTLGQILDERMPGADDDGSGSATAMEVARVLLASQRNFKRPVYIIWYAAEERGLVGSQQVVQYFKAHSIPVYAVMQLDMTGYRSNEMDKTMWIYRDFTDKPLSDFMAMLIRNYIKVPIAYSKCGYGCSDHASWTLGKIPAAFACEASFKDVNPFIHTNADGLGLLSLDHMTNFTKLGLAFAIELASD